MKSINKAFEYSRTCRPFSIAIWKDTGIVWKTAWKIPKGEILEENEELAKWREELDIKIADGLMVKDIMIHGSTSEFRVLLEKNG